MAKLSRELWEPCCAMRCNGAMPFPLGVHETIFLIRLISLEAGLMGSFVYQYKACIHMCKYIYIYIYIYVYIHRSLQASQMERRIRFGCSAMRNSVHMSRRDSNG